jgi:hypothetical protein
MLGIIKKDVWSYLLYTALMAPFPLLLTYQDGMTAGSIVLLGQVMVSAILVAAVGNEALEHASGGYQFLKNLPLTDREVLLAKHLLPLGAAALHVLYGYVLLLLFPVSEQFFRLSLGYLVVLAQMCLLIAAALFFFVYRFGVPGLTRLTAVAVPLAVIVLFLGTQFKALRWARYGITKDDLRRLAELASGLNLLLTCCAGLALFFGIMSASVRAKVRREV